MRPTAMPEIRRLPLFRDMLQANFDALMQDSYVQSFPEGMALIRQGDPADYLHIVVEGAVELFGEWQENRCTMAVVHPVGAFIVAACIRDVPCLMSARTLERSRIVLVPASDLRAVFRRDPEFAVSVVTDLAGSFRALVRDAKGLKLRTTRQRIAGYLLQQSRLAGGADSFVLRTEKRLIASFLGMTPENLSRALKSLEPCGLQVRGQTVTITDRAALTAVCPPDALIDGPEPGGPEAAAPAAGISLPGPRLIAS